MLVLLRKRAESVVVGGANGFEHMLKATVLERRAKERDWGLQSMKMLRSTVGRCGNEFVLGMAVGRTPVRKTKGDAATPGFQIERTRYLAHESEREPERPWSASISDMLFRPGLMEGTSQVFKAEPSKPADEHGGPPSRSLCILYPNIPVLYYG